jgi:hypothetical protein
MTYPELIARIEVNIEVWREEGEPEHRLARIEEILREFRAAERADCAKKETENVNAV